jgi:hypothetical protein
MRKTLLLLPSMTLAVLLQLKVPAVPSHVSAAVLQDLAEWNVDLSVVHITRADLHAARLEAGVMHHAARLPEEDVCLIGDIPVTGPARTAVDIARMVQFEQAVVTADSALARMDNDHDRLLQTLERMRTWRGARGAGRVVAFADGAAESVGESRARVQFERIGLPRPRLQVEILGSDGEVYRPDFLDINFGCPVKKVVCRDGGAGILRNLPKMRALTEAEQDSKELKSAKRQLLFDRIIEGVELPFPVGPAPADRPRVATRDTTVC